LEKSYNIIEQMDKRLKGFEQEIVILTDLVRDLDIKLQYEKS